jgi:hypothetical protein
VHPLPLQSDEVKKAVVSPLLPPYRRETLRVAVGAVTMTSKMVVNSDMLYSSLLGHRAVIAFR